MQAVVCIKWKCTSTECEIRFITYEFDSTTPTGELRSWAVDQQETVAAYTDIESVSPGGGCACSPSVPA